PFLNYSVETFEILSKLGFQYDSSVTALREDASWPYTLDNGLAHDCTTSNFCDKVVHPGFFEIPMAAIIDEANVAHLMDPYLDASTDTVKKWLQDNFNYHTQNGKTPFGLYIHPVQLNIPGRDNASLITMLEEFLDWALAQPNVWFVTSQQLITWMQNPVPASELKDYAPFKCQAPKIDKKICNGITDDGLLETCSFPNGSWSTCYGCPTSDITLDNPVPPGGNGSRHRLPNNCDTVWWDPIGNACLCTDSSCAYVDTSVPITNSTNNNSTGSNNSSPTGDGKSNSNGQKSDASSLLSSSVLMIGLMALGLLQFL
ncbi:16882_t:CDS:2, partial [Dentiscutata heterogama]